MARLRLSNKEVNLFMYVSKKNVITISLHCLAEKQIGS